MDLKPVALQEKNPVRSTILKHGAVKLAAAGLGEAEAALTAMGKQ